MTGAADTNTGKRTERTVLYSSLFLLALYVIASFIPDSWLWGIHQLAFLPVALRIVLLVVSFLLIGIPTIHRFAGSAIERIKKINLSTSVVIIIGVGTGIVACIFFDRFREAMDIYGDTRTLLAGLRKYAYSLNDIFSPNESEALTRYLHQGIAAITGMDLRTGIAWSSIVCGGVYITVMALFARSLRLPLVVKAIFIVLAFSLGGIQLFLGHVEDYTYVYLVLTLLLIAGWKFFQGEKMLGWLVAGFLVGLRLHVITILFVPALIYAFVWHTRKKREKPALAGRKILNAVGLSLLIAAALYFFYFKAYQYVRHDEQEVHEKVFLPFINPLPEPHYYTVWSAGHISDVSQVMLYVLSPGILIVLALAVAGRRLIKWNDPKIIFYALGSFYSLLFCFTDNPLLTYVRDWDLFAFTGLPLLFFSLSILGTVSMQKEFSFSLQRLLCSTFGLALISCSMWFVNADTKMAGERVRQAGRAAFKTYYLGSTYIINTGEKEIADPRAQLAAREETIHSLQQFAGSEDGEMSNLTTAAARLAISLKDFSSANELYNLSLQYDSLNATSVKGIGLCALIQGDYARASGILHTYNMEVNTPQVIDPEGLMLSQLADTITALKSTRADSTTIQQKLDMILAHYK